MCLFVCKNTTKIDYFNTNRLFFTYIHFYIPYFCYFCSIINMPILNKKRILQTNKATTIMKKILFILVSLLAVINVNAQVYGSGNRVRHTTSSAPVTRQHSGNKTIVNQKINIITVNPNGTTTTNSVTNGNTTRQNTRVNNNSSYGTYNNSSYSSAGTDRSTTSSSSSSYKPCPKQIRAGKKGGCFNGTYECTTCATEKAFNGSAKVHTCSNCGEKHVRDGGFSHTCKCTSSTHKND